MEFVTTLAIVAAASALSSAILTFFNNYIGKKKKDNLVQEIRIKSGETEKTIIVDLTKTRNEIENKIMEAFEILSPKIFISYSHKDLNIATKLIEALQNENVNIWHDQQIKVGENWDQEINKAIKESKYNILLLSNNFLVSEYANNELMKMISENKKIIPILISESISELPESLKYLKYGNYHSKPEETIEEIKGIIRGDTDAKTAGL